jgi:hypothetical protein
MKIGKDAYAYYEFVTTLEVREALFILPADIDVVFRRWHLRLDSRMVQNNGVNTDEIHGR